MWFPAVQQHGGSSTKQKSTFVAAQKFIPRPVQQQTMKIAAKQKELKQRMAIAQQRYLEGGTEEDLRKVNERLMFTQEKIAAIKQLIEENAVSGSPENGTVHPVSKLPGSKY